MDDGRNMWCFLSMHQKCPRFYVGENTMREREGNHEENVLLVS